MKEIENMTVFRTSDLALAAALSVLGFAIKDIEKVQISRAVFIFSDSTDCRKMVDLYWRGELSVNPQSYFNELKSLKSRIYER